KIGLTAGASAPEILIQQVVQRLQQWGGQTPQEITGREENVVFSMPKELRIPSIAL
ncbi:MAG TPA: 4-hydroxy-3-methylbut-2-enyl diphosphate reductase, partial [Agitococcus sp.]|nr:4-hydroxy-3-methylbut-2-enyl diphosphate reductase [Agitococcus sp.]